LSEASGGGGRAEIERKIVERRLQDEVFRRRLLADPRATLEQEYGERIPEGVQVRAVEETPDTIYLVLPSSSAGAGAGGLSDQDLEAVAGGDTSWTCSGWSCGPPDQCQTAVGPGCTS